MTTRIAAAVGLLVLATSAPAADRPESLRELRAARETARRRAGSLKGYPRARALQDERRLDALIEDLEAGRPVDPAAIDEALRAAERPL